MWPDLMVWWPTEVSEEACIALKTLHPALGGCSRLLALALPVSYFTKKKGKTLGASHDMASKINGSMVADLAMD